jgi:hypothetical protein
MKEYTSLTDVPGARERAWDVLRHRMSVRYKTRFIVVDDEPEASGGVAAAPAVDDASTSDDVRRED